MVEPSKLNISSLNGVGPKWTQLFASAGVYTYEDLLNYFPYKYIDRSRIFTIAELHPDMPYVQICGRFVDSKTVGEGKSKRLTAIFTDGTANINIVWFKYIDYTQKRINNTDEFLLFGKPTMFGSRMNIAHPEMVKYTASTSSEIMGLQPVYNTSETMKRAGLTTKGIHKILAEVFAQVGNDIVETLPASLLQQLNLMTRGEALRTIHFPKDTETLERARFRLKFEELFYVNLKLLRGRNGRRAKRDGIVFATSGDLLNDFYNNHRPYDVTNAQARVMREIRHDLGSGYQMNRLLQGDVGSGKTFVALMTMLIAVGNGYQCCLMAPTEILATQHYENFVELLQPYLQQMRINVELLTGSTTQKKRREIAIGLTDGTLNILVGTHALIEDNVQFKNMGLAIIDEQHRFGVEQRARLQRKAGLTPHILVMTATPIPRTLAMTLYGDLDVSVIDELPPGRKAIRTEHYFHSQRNKLNAFIRTELQKGRQAYVVYPLVEESEKMDFKNLTDGFEYTKKAFPEFQVAMVHGKMKSTEKDEAMKRFANREAQILVATTVIEVGVNVPNATIMIIESAERFGLSQLHQLRGRVGRGGDQSYCILLTDPKLSADTRNRMQIMVDTTDGFRIAEEDLRMRGAGNIDGTQQSGMNVELHIADLATDGRIVQYSREVAERILMNDPLLEKPESDIYVRRLKELADGRMNWSQIS